LRASVWSAEATSNQSASASRTEAPNTSAQRGIDFDVVRRLAGRGRHVFATVQTPAEVGRCAFGDRVGAEKLAIRDAAGGAKAASWDVDVPVDDAVLGDPGPLLEIDVPASGARSRPTCPPPSSRPGPWSAAG
jgi:hypothetical protein